MDVQTIYENLLFVTVRIEVELETGGKSTGTGFIYEYKFSDKKALFIVTNKHVLENGSKAFFQFNESDGKNPIIGSRVGITLEGLKNAWYGHSDPSVDVAVLPLGPILQLFDQNKKAAFYRTVDFELAPTDAQIAELDVMEEVLFIGYPNGIFDSKNLLPVFRRGITASPASVDFSGNPTFLIDASVFPGSSGSPVFICNLGSYMSKKGMMLGASRIYLLGIIASVYVRSEFNKVELMPIPTQSVPVVENKQMINLGTVFKSICIKQTIDQFFRKNGISV